MTDYNKIRAQHFDKRIHELLGLFNHSIYALNTAIIDNNIQKINMNSTKLNALDMSYSLDSFSYLKEKQKLDIAYLFPHSLLTGGLKILVEQANNLHTRGYNVSIYSHSPKPDWIEVNCNYFLVPPDCDLCDFISKTDIVIAGYWDLTLDAVKINAPIKYYFSQGDIEIFKFNDIDPFLRNASIAAHNLPVKILTVSNIMKTKLKELYGRESVVIPNAIDNTLFYPQKRKSNSPLEILLIGHDKLTFKGQDDIINALYQLKLEGYNFRVKWAIPEFPSMDYTKAKLNIQHHICPTQDELGRIYRTADIYISGSYYESFSLPPLEAMASGIAVITTLNEGVKEYAVDNKNCMMYEAGIIVGLKEKIKLLLESKDLRSNLVKNGKKAAKQYSWDKSIDILEKEFMSTKNNLKVAILYNAN